MTKNYLFSIADNFVLEGTPKIIEPTGHGHINNTYLVVTELNKKYILQRISDAFDIKSLMKNIDAVTSFMALKSENPERQMHLIHTKTDKNYFAHESGNYRVFTFVEDSICLDAPETTGDFFESAVAFGTFQRLLEDFPAKTLSEPIKNFHNTVDRYRIFKKTLNKDTHSRAKRVKKEIEFALNREEKAGTLQRMRDAGEIPVRVTHNDTKLNNVLFDKATGDAITVIDLDTVMPGLVAYDFGDAVRFAANKCAEDCPDPSFAEIDMDIFSAFTKGFLSETGGVLTQNEKDTLALSGFVVACELAVRFLDDYLTGDRYFNIDYEGHNLVRARCQLALARNMMMHLGKMEELIKRTLS